MGPGDLVRCVTSDLLYFALLKHMPSACPELGLIYTITGIHRNCASCGEDHVSIKEMASPFINGYPARWFSPWSEDDFASFMSALMPTRGEIFEG